MKRNGGFGQPMRNPAIACAESNSAIYPRSFAHPPSSTDLYLGEPAAGKLAEFFQAKGLARLKQEDAREDWYQDWIEHQAQSRLYASVISPKQFSTLGFEFDLLKLTRFLEVFAYFSPAHGYSLQTTFLGFFSILMGSNDELKREAVAALEAGELLAFGISEKNHGSDLLGNDFAVREAGPGQFVANGGKYYIGNSNCAAIISILARKEDARSAGRPHRAPLILFALRPRQSSGFQNIGKIRTLGVRSAYVGEFQVKDYTLPASDFIAEGRQAWDAVFGTVTLGKFLLGFGSIGICEHALEEAIAHLSSRILYRKPVLEMPHIRLATAQAYARLTAMKLYAYRALDYVHAASARDRRYLLFCSVQKAKVSTEGVKVVAQLSECVGARGFESETYFESALRDIQLIPGLEGSTHINIGQAVQFIARYFAAPAAGDDLADPKSLTAGQAAPGENPYLMQARAGSINDIAFPHFLKAYEPLSHVPNVAIFRKQLAAFRFLIEGQGRGLGPIKIASADLTDLRFAMAYGQCMATIAYAQLIAENAMVMGVPAPMISAIFHLLISDLSAAAQILAALPGLDSLSRLLARRVIAIPKTSAADWGFVSAKVAAPTDQPPAAGHPVSGNSDQVSRVEKPAANGLRHVSGNGDRSTETSLLSLASATEPSLLWKLLRVPARILAWSLFDLKVYGRRHVPKHGGVLIVANHQSNLDPVLLGAQLQRPLNYIAKSELFRHRVAGRLLRGLNGFPVRHGKGDVGALKETIRRLQNGHLVNIYPEGKRTPDGCIQPLQKGVALIIKRAGVPVIPAVIVGTFEAWPIHNRFFRPAPVRIRFGPPLQLDGLHSEEAIIAAIESRLRRMFDQMQRHRSHDAGNGRQPKR